MPHEGMQVETWEVRSERPRDGAERRALGLRDRLKLTVLGWSPGLRATLGGRTLPCGCRGGWYELADGSVAFAIAAAGDRCRNPRHRTAASN